MRAGVAIETLGSDTIEFTKLRDTDPLYFESMANVAPHLSVCPPVSLAITVSILVIDPCNIQR